jgi:hypothetical protein
MYASKEALAFQDLPRKAKLRACWGSKTISIAAPQKKGKERTKKKRKKKENKNTRTQRPRNKNMIGVLTTPVYVKISVIHPTVKALTGQFEIPKNLSNGGQQKVCAFLPVPKETSSPRVKPDGREMPQNTREGENNEKKKGKKKKKK